MPSFVSFNEWKKNCTSYSISNGTDIMNENPFLVWMKDIINANKSKTWNLPTDEDKMDALHGNLSKEEKKIILNLYIDLQQEPKIDETITNDKVNVLFNLMRSALLKRKWFELLELLRHPVRSSDVKFILMVKSLVWMNITSFEMAEQFLNKI